MGMNNYVRIDQSKVVPGLFEPKKKPYGDPDSGSVVKPYLPHWHSTLSTSVVPLPSYMLRPRLVDRPESCVQHAVAALEVQTLEQRHPPFPGKVRGASPARGRATDDEADTLEMIGYLLSLVSLQ